MANLNSTTLSSFSPLTEGKSPKSAQKKPLNPAQVENYRWFSLLPFLSKILEHTVFNQVSGFLSENNL